MQNNTGFYSYDLVRIVSDAIVDYTFAEVNNTKGLGPGYAIGKRAFVPARKLSILIARKHAGKLVS